MAMDESRKFLDLNIDFDSTVVLALSGGADSMCLFHLLWQLKQMKNIKIVCCHVNHMVRNESEEEEAFIKDYLAKYDVYLEIKRLEEYKVNKFRETDARKKRYAFFESVVNKYHAKYLLTAHHGDDLIETVLMRITRGSNLKGYMGIRTKDVSRNYTLLRPLLFCEKKDILNYNDYNGIPYVCDKSNESEKYTRNRYRKHMLPYLKKEYCKVHEKYLQFSYELGDYFSFVKDYIDEKGFIVDNSIVINKIKNESDFIKRKAIESLINEIQKEDTIDISSRQVRDMVKLLLEKNKSIDLNNGYVCEVSYGILKIIKKQEIKKYKLILQHDMKFYDGNILFLNDSLDDTNYCLRLSSQDVVLPLWIRNKKNGDIMTVKGLCGHKKLSDIFINEKVPRRKRDVIPIITDSLDTILWIPGVKKSKFAKDKSEKYDIILKYEVKGKNECEIKTK